MDKRAALPAGYELRFPGLTCTVEGETGRGSNAIVYQGWYPDASDPKQRHQVLIKELFPYQEQGAICRDPETGCLRCLPESAEALEMHRESFRWGNEIHLRLKKTHPDETGGNINTYACQGTYYTLLDYTGGRTLNREQAARREPPTLRRIVRRCIGILEALAAFHDSGFLHLDISPDNVILLNQGRRERVELIDYNSVVRLSDLESGDPLRLSMKPGYASPEVRKGDVKGIGPWTDIYSVAAVFYYCLMDGPLSRMQLSGLAPVSVNGSKYLQDAQPTVKAQAQKLLARGLAASGKRRCQSVPEMLEEFRELLDRIDGIGITHWALWESCAGSVRREVGSNPGFAYLTEEASLYPMELRTEKGERLTSLLDGSTHRVLTGSGGMGKTTLLLHTAWQESRNYRPDRPVICYLPLFDYTTGNTNYIHDKILGKMRFSADTNTYESARHGLDLLLQKPLATGQGPRPVLHLLLDGYNEMTADPEGLQKEIRQLARMEGVSILIASRSGLPEYHFESCEISPLDDAVISEYLGRNGLLLPEEPQVRSLMHNPMMLSLFIRACLNQGVQLKVEDGEALIRAYLDALEKKELDALPENAALRWQISAAVRCVLPVIADLGQTQRLTNGQMVQSLSRIYQLLQSSLIRKHYPEWVGHTGEIRGNAENGEAWYRLMVRDILWRRLGLLVRDSEGQYRVFHQEFQDALAPRGKTLREAVARRKKVGLLAAVLAALALAGTLLCLTGWSRPYDGARAIEMLGDIQSLWVAVDQEQRLMLELLDNGEFDSVRSQMERPGFVVLYDRGDYDGDLVAEYTLRLQDLEETGSRLPWSKDLHIGAQEVLEGVRWFHALQARYLEYTGVLERAWTGGPEDYAHCCSLVRSVVEADLQVSAAYYVITYDTKVKGMDGWEATLSGKDQAGAANTLAGAEPFHPALAAAIRQIRQSREELPAILNEARQRSEDCRSTLSRDKVFQRYQ